MAQKGVERVVLLPALTVEYGGGERRFADQFKAHEDAVESSGLQWTLLRCSRLRSKHPGLGPADSLHRGRARCVWRRADITDP